MNDSTPLIGMLGTGLSLTLGQWNEILGICAGSLTCAYMIWRLIILYKGGKKQD